MKKILMGIICCLIAVCSGFSSNVGDVDYECPICSLKFKYKKQFSYTLFGKNLDLKPTGAAIIPQPIPKCRKCGFVFDKDLFTDDEIKMLKEYLEHNKLPDADKNYPNYYYLAQEMILLKKPIEDIAWFFLESVWENKNKDDNTFLLKNALQYMASISEDSKLYENYLLIRIDLERRLKNFDKALKLIEEVKGRKGFYKDYIVEIINYQEKLIADKDTNEHKLP